MNKDREVAKVKVTNDSAYIVETYDVIPPYIHDIFDWINCRSSPVGRANIQYLMKLAGIRNKSEYLSVTHGISMRDTLWFREEHSKIAWDKISPYTNSFSRVISEICLNGNYKYSGELRSPSPDYKIDGSIDKCWKRVNGEIYLYKTAGECINMFMGIRTYMEYYASQIAKQLITDKNHFIDYKIRVDNTSTGRLKPYVVCPCFTSEKYGLLDYGDSVYKNLNIGEFDKNIHGDSRSRIILREMLVLDSIILNHDRHDGNYGFLVDNDTYDIYGLTPIFDNDCSMGYFVSLQSIESFDKGFNIALSRQARAGMGDYIDQAKWAMTSEIYNNMRNMYPFHFDRLPSGIDLPDKRIQFMEYIVNRQIKTILASVSK